MAKRAPSTPGTPATVAATQTNAAELRKLRDADTGFKLAQEDAVKFLISRKQAIYNIARTYHLDPDELHQEGYEVLLTCLRDFTPIYTKADGETVAVKFTTFFGNRMDTRAMEMRNRDPEYQARQAHIADMPEEERQRFRADPPLLVQHLDKETSLQEALRGEAAEAADTRTGDIRLKILRDSFFDQKLAELVAREPDEKKRVALLHVKVGGVFSFQEMAYHFGVTDSRASQILNDLMDAFYVQRLLDGSLTSVTYDFKKLKFTPKRILRLVTDALPHATPERATQIHTRVLDAYPDLAPDLPAPSANHAADLTLTDAHTNKTVAAPSVYSARRVQLADPQEWFTPEELAAFPRRGVEQRDASSLTPLALAFRPTDAQQLPAHIAAIFARDQARYPVVIQPDGTVIDGVHRLNYALANGVHTLTCFVHDIPDAETAQTLRVSLNLRQSKPEKSEMYFAICALADIGLSQQRIADALGTSRTNIIVYTKVKDKGAPALRRLFEDGLVQITNASACVDLPADVQTRVADFIRTYGPEWSKGSPFNDLLSAAKSGKLAQLEKKLGATRPMAIPTGNRVTALANATDLPPLVKNLQGQLNQYQQALRDAEIWTAQRESIITRQTEELTTLKGDLEKIRQELDAAELSRFGDPAVMAQALSEIRAFHDVSSRVASCAHGANQAITQLRKLKINQRQQRELLESIELLERAANALRVSVLSKVSRRPFHPPETSENFE